MDLGKLGQPLVEMSRGLGAHVTEVLEYEPRAIFVHNKIDGPSSINRLSVVTIHCQKLIS